MKGVKYINIDEISYDPRVVVHINNKKDFLKGLTTCWEEVIIFVLPDGTLICMIEPQVMWVCKER